MSTRLVVAVALLGGCLEPGLVPCGIQLCPAGDVCTADQRCAAPADLTACEGLADGDVCDGARGVGACVAGVCTSGTCGNGELDAVEACDDGNVTSGDGCRADCAKVERCGDAVLDDGEPCDDGNDNAVDGCDACQRQRWVATTAVGGVQLAIAGALDEPTGIAVDGYGNVYVVEPDTNRVRKVGTDGSITTIAGTGELGFGGDGGQAASALLRTPKDVAVDALGTVYVADSGNHRIRAISADGVIRTIAGTGVGGTTGDGGLASAATLSSPDGVVVDGLGNVYVADASRVRRIRIDGVIEAFAGVNVAGYSGDGGQATSAMLHSPHDLAIDDAGDVLIVDTDNNRIRRVSPAGIITTIAGTGASGAGGDNGPALSATIYQPIGIAIANDGSLYISHIDSIRVVSPDGIIHHVAGVGYGDFTGDGGPATTAALDSPDDIALAPDGSLVLADSNNNRVRRIANGTITTVAGIGNEGLIGDGGDATAAQYGYPHGIGVTPAGMLYIADTDFYRVRAVAATGDVSTIAGTGLYADAGDGGPASAAQLEQPEDVAVDANGNVYVADSEPSRIRRIATDGTISTVAGTGTAGFSGDGGPATAAELSGPTGVAITSAGDLLIADHDNHRIRRVDAQGTIHTFAGDGTAAFAGDGGAATTASLNGPTKVAVRGTDVWIADTENQRVRRVDGAGLISTFAGGGSNTGDGGLATAATLLHPSSVAVDAAGIVYIGEGNRVRKIALDATISTVISSSQASSKGDGGPVANAAVYSVEDVACDAAGALYILDGSDRKVRRVSAAGTISTAAGFIGPEGAGPVATARLATPVALAVAGARMFVATGVQGVIELVTGGRVRRAIGRYPHVPATGVLASFQDESFGSIGGVAVDEATGTIYLTEQSANRIHAVTTSGPGIDPALPETWTIAVLANATGVAGAADGPLAGAQFREPSGLLFDPALHTLYVADTGNHAIRAIDVTAGTVSTVVNAAHSLGFAGDDGRAGDALLYRPTALARCPNGDLFIADTGNHRVRRIATSQAATVSAATITTVLGDGVRASSGEGEPSRNFPVAAPAGITCDAANNVFVSSTTTVRALPANAASVVDGNGPVLTIYGLEPRLAFPESQTQCLTGVVSLTATGSTTSLQVADACTGLLVELTRQAAP